MSGYEATEAALIPWLTEHDIPYAAVIYEGDREDLPDSYLVYDQITETHTSYDNAPVSDRVRMQIDFMSRNASDMTTMPGQIEAAMLVAGFALADGGGRVAYSHETNHWYWQKDFILRIRRGWNA